MSESENNINDDPAVQEFQRRIMEITKKQLELFLKVDKVVTEEKIQKVRTDIDRM